MNGERLDDVLAVYSGLKDGEVEDYTAGHPFEYRVEYRAGKAGAGAEAGAGFGVPRAKSRRRWAGVGAAAAAVCAAAAGFSVIAASTANRYAPPAEANIVALRTPLGIKKVVLETGASGARERAAGNFTTDFRIKTF